MSRNKILFGILVIVLAVLSACSTKKPAGQLMMDVTGESFPIEKSGIFGKDHYFWAYQINDVSRSSKQSSTISLKGSDLQTQSRATGFTLADDAGYEWDVVALAELQLGRKPGVSKRDRNVVSYTVTGRMEESTTMLSRSIRAEYKPGNTDFDGSLRGEVTNEKKEVICTFESNPRLDVHRKPDDGLQVFSISIGDTVVAVLDSRNGYEITFFEGLLPTQRTQVASTAASLFVLMKYGIL